MTSKTFEMYGDTFMEVTPQPWMVKASELVKSVVESERRFCVNLRTGQLTAYTPKKPPKPTYALYVMVSEASMPEARRRVVFTMPEDPAEGLPILDFFQKNDAHSMRLLRRMEGINDEHVGWTALGGKTFASFREAAKALYEKRT
jgi:hypothetical protein